MLSKPRNDECLKRAGCQEEPRQRKAFLIRDTIMYAGGAGLIMRIVEGLVLPDQLWPASNDRLTLWILRGIQGHLVPQGEVVHGLRSC